MAFIKTTLDSYFSRWRQQPRLGWNESARAAKVWDFARFILLVALLAFASEACGQDFSLPSNPENRDFYGPRAQPTGYTQGGSYIDNNAPAPPIERLPPPPQPQAGRQLLVRPPTAVMGSNGQLNVQPNVEVLDRYGQSVGYAGAGAPAPQSSGTSGWSPGSLFTGRLPLIEPLPAAAMGPEEIGSGQYGNPDGEEFAEPTFGEAWGGVGQGIISRVFGFRSRSEGLGIGHERVMLAPFEIEASQPFSNYRFRTDSAFGYHNPSRGEYLWANPMPGLRRPTATGTDYTDLRFMSEIATGKSFSIATEIPLRLLFPDGAPRYTAGMSDMNVATKLVMLNGQNIQITQLFRTYFPTGASSRGLGNGHVSMEPGFLARYKWSPETYFHGQLKYWFAIPPGPLHPATVLEYGVGVSHLYYETDCFALIGTLEGAASTLQNALDGSVNGTMFNLAPGLRIASDRGGDLGLFEFGVSGNLALGDSRNRWYNSLLRIEFRWSY